MPCYHPMALKSKYDYRGMPLIVPCSRCIGCRLERSRQWAVRCVNEAQMHEDNAFLTLTYKDESLTFGRERATLFPRHLQLFFKRLRKKHGNNIRYFACGEYGEETNRPHYHACVFGLKIDDKKLWSIRNGNYLYNSENLDKIWKLGQVIIGDVTFESAAYVARYIVAKKLGKNASYYEEEGIEPEFVRMSRRPGLGSKWLDKYSNDVYPHDYMIIRNGVKSKPPRYYTEKYSKISLDNQRTITSIKITRINKAYEKQSENTPQRLKVKETIKQAQLKQLPRKNN